MLKLPEIPHGSILGLNYSGMHDSAIVIVTPNGEPIFAISLERISRIKQDGRPPHALLENIPWERISKVAVSTEREFHSPTESESKLLECRLPCHREEGLKHRKSFYDFIDLIPSEKEFVCHQLAHASSAFWGSTFNEALCLTYDGGMFNSPWFGGLYRADRKNGLQPLDRFNALLYAKVTSLYTFVTALLGFTPNKHEGKITGLAAYGTPTDPSRRLIRRWFEEEFLEIEETMEWVFCYDETHPPMLLVNDARMERFRKEATTFSRKELSATIQEFSENHVLGILAKAVGLGWTSDNICLAGGLFSNVRINQQVVNFGFEKIFVTPPMTDEGTALGAAWHVLSKQADFSPKPLHSVYFGPRFSDEDVKSTLTSERITYEVTENPEEKLSTLLASGAVVAVFQGSMEFGPRALGNRSILAQATDPDINRVLNERLNRTEFMPFAPVSRVEDAADCYINLDHITHAIDFMTVTVDCTKEMRDLCPAVVHVDGTARPQLVSKESNVLIHTLLTRYKAMTGKPALVNTSFNIHEEPIVCSPSDALRGFFESGLDYLYFGNGMLVAFNDNMDVALRYLQEKHRQPNLKSKMFASIMHWQSKVLQDKETEIYSKEHVIKELLADRLANERVIKDLREDIIKKEESLFNKESVIIDQSLTIKAYRTAYGASPLFFLRLFARGLRRLTEIFSIRLGKLAQYSPRPIRLGKLLQYSPRILTHLKRGKTSALPQAVPKISIVTPSFQQGVFIERTIKSVLDQGYPNLEYFVQDGGSTDQTLSVLKAYDGQLFGWCSEKDFGQSHAINKGFSHTTGEIMAWLNSDDLLLPGALSCVAQYFSSHPRVDVIYGNRLLIDEDDMEIGRWILPYHDSEVLSWADYVPQETLFWRREVWEKVGGIDESFRFAMDWDLLVRFRDAGVRFAHISQFLGAFRVHANQKTSASANDLGYREMSRIRKKIHGRIPNHKEIKMAILPFMVRHVAVDLAYRLKSRFRRKV